MSLAAMLLSLVQTPLNARLVQYTDFWVPFSSFTRVAKLAARETSRYRYSTSSGSEEKGK